MQRTTPSVEGGRLYQAERGAEPIVVGTPTWYDWLEQHTSFLFVDHGEGFTAHKRGTDPSDLAWNASRTRQGQLYRVWLGPSHTLTLERLQAAARSLAGEHDSAGLIEADGFPAVPAASHLPVPKTAAPVSPASSLLRTKLYRPRTNGDVIPRTHLIERLNAGLSSKVTLVSAPAGFGKTTLLAEWLQRSDRHTAWLSLDENDDELRVFVHLLIAALHTVFPDACLATASLLTAAQFPPAERVVTLLINDLADVPEDVVLVLDDYHLIRTSQVHTWLELLIKHLPPQLHLVLATRSDPPLPLARWRAQGQLNELRSADLRFTLEETEAFLARMLGKEVAHKTAMALEERTDGWIAVVRLAALSLRSAPDTAAFLERLRHYPDRSVSRYLVEEILSRQAPFVQEVLERMSILEQFCAALCVAVMRHHASNAQVQATLDGLERSHAFLVPLDEHQGWYRFHHLFKPLLQQRLQEHISTEELAVLHRRASAWYAAQGLIEHAIEHALRAREVLGATSLVEAQFFRAF